MTDLHLDQSISGWDVAFAAITIVATWIAGRLVRRGVLGLLGKVQGAGEDLRRFLGRVAKYFVWVVGAGVALSFLGAQVQPLLAAAVIIAVVMALALRGVAENFGAGLVIQTRHAIQLGDTIESLGHVGIVTAINGRAVVIETADGQRVHLPNSEVLDHPIVNDSIRGRRRSDLQVRAAIPVGRVDDVNAAITEGVAATTSVDHDVEPLVATVAIEPERVTILVRVWHEPASGPRARSELMHAIARACAARQIDVVVQTPPPPPPLTPPPRL